MNPTIMQLGYRSLSTRAPLIAMGVSALLFLLLTVVLGAVNTDPEPDDVGVVLSVGLAILVPIVALTAVTRIVTGEADDGSILYLVTKPVPRLTIVFSKFLVILTYVLLIGAVVMLLGGVIVGDGTAGAAAGVGALVSGLGYAAIFTVLGFVFKRSIVASLVYFILFDLVVGGLVPGFKWVSAYRWGRETMYAIGNFDTHPQLPGWYGIVAALVVTAFAVWFASRRVAHISTGD